MEIITNVETLAQPSEPLTFLTAEGAKTEEGSEIISKIKEAMEQDTKILALAAPQIGINRRVVAVQRFDKEGEPFEVYPNISIIETSEELAPGPEGCLSVPNQRHEVMRHTWVTIQYYSLEAHKVVQERIEGFTAVIFQHEVDHLSGVLYIDRVGQ